MVSLLDLKRGSRLVPTSGGDVLMYAISAESIGHLVGAFPLVSKLMEGKAESSDFTAATIVSTAPKLVEELIACGADLPGDPAALTAARTLPLGDQLALLVGVLEASMGTGPGPFLAAAEKLAKLFSASGMKVPASA